MYYVSQEFKNQIAKEENIPVICIKIETGNYWNTLDGFASGWSGATVKDPATSGTITISHSDAEYRSYGGSSCITFEDGKNYTAGDYGQVSKSVNFDVNTEGIRIWFNGKCEYLNKIYIGLYVNGSLKVEKDLFNCRDTWSNQLQWIDDSISGSTTIAVRVYVKESFSDIGSSELNVYIDDLEEFIPYNEDGAYFFTNFDQDFQYWDVSSYTQGTLGAGSMSSYEKTFSRFPFQLTRGELSLDRKDESVSISVAIGDSTIMNAIMSLDDMRGKLITIMDTFWDCRRNADDGGDHDCFKKEVYEIAKIDSDEGKGVIVFTLKSKFIANQVMIPNEPYDRDFCRHEYKSVSTTYIAGCNYSGALADCDHTLNGENGCVVHNNTPNFGAHPAIPSGIIRV